MGLYQLVVLSIFVLMQTRRQSCFQVMFLVHIYIYIYISCIMHDYVWQDCKMSTTSHNNLSFVSFVLTKGINIHPATLTTNFAIPFWREIILRVGAISVSAFSLKVRI